MDLVSSIKAGLASRIKELSNAIDIARSILATAPEGKLRISHNQGTIQYYHILDSEDTRGKYIKKKDRALVCQLAQKDYAARFLKVAEDELANVQAALSALGKSEATPRIQGMQSAEDVYRMLREERKNLVKPILANDTDFAEIWELEPYKTNDYKSEEKVYPTRKGDLVRSKSEAILADMYYALGIPYRYEAELVLKNGKRVYPDFTLLNTRNRSVVYHEHMGLLDDDEYRYHGFRKIAEYSKNGIFSGKNLIITIEGNGCPLNIRDIEICTKELFGINSAVTQIFL